MRAGIGIYVGMGGSAVIVIKPGDDEICERVEDGLFAYCCWFWTCSCSCSCCCRSKGNRSNRSKGNRSNRSNRSKGDNRRLLKLGKDGFHTL